MTKNSSLRMFCYTWTDINGTYGDFVVAESAEEATGLLHEAVEVSADPDAWTQVPDTDTMNIVFNNDKYLNHTTMCDASDPKAREVQATMGEWAKLFGKGYLCTNEM